MTHITLERQILDILDGHRSQDRAVTRRQLETHTKVSDRLIRDCISELQSKGIPIVSLSKGYYLANESDLESYLRREWARIYTQIKKLKAMRGIRKFIGNQLEIF